MLRMEQRVLHLGEGEGVIMATLPHSFSLSSPHSVLYGGGVDKGWEWHLDSWSFSSQGVAEAKTQGLACSPCLLAALRRNRFPPPAACPTSQS